MRRYWIILLAVLASGCMLDPLDRDQLPVWSTTLELPLLQTEVTLDTIVEDSLISERPTGENGDLIYVFNKTAEIERVEVGNKLKIDPSEERFVQYASAITIDSTTTGMRIGYDPVGLDDITEVISAEIGLIELSNIEPEETDPFLFSEIMPASLVAPIENAINALGGSADVVVDTIGLVPQQKPLSFDSFHSAEVSSGYLDVTIINDMFIPLGAPIYVDVKTSIDTFRLAWDTEIPVGGSATLTKDLSGLTLSGDLLIEVSGTSNGSQGEIVTVTNADLSSSFRTRAEVRDIQATQTEAIVPEQTTTDGGTITLDPSETVVEEAILLSGDLTIAVANNLPMTGHMELTISSLFDETTDSMYRQNFEIQLGTATIPGSDLAGWTMAMDFAEQQLTYNYRITTDETDPEYVTIDQIDNVELDLAITNISFREVTGQIEEQTITENSEIDIESDSRIQRALISDGHMKIGIVNQIGGEANVQVTMPGLIRSGNSLDTVLIVNPGSDHHIIDLAGYYAIPVSVEDQRLTYHTETVTQGGFHTYDLLDSIDVELKLSELTFDEVIGYISQEDNIKEDAVELNNETKVQTAVIESGEIRLAIRNFVGLPADILIEVAEMSKGGSSLAVSIPVTSSPEPVLETVDVSGYALSLPLHDQRIHYVSTLKIPNDELLSLTLNDSITVELLIDTLRFTSVTGIIDTVEVEIDTVEQEIATLPEEMDGFDFANVELGVEFDSDITLPVFLDLTMEATNAVGDIETSSVSNWNITDSARVIMPDATDLINIRPDQILAYGTARVGGTAASGTVTSTQSIAGMLVVRAPLEFEIGSDAVIITDPHMVTGKDAERTVAGEIEETLVFVRYDNEFNFGVSLRAFMSQDTLSFDDGTADVLVDSLVLNPAESGVDSLVLNDERLDLFNQDSMYIQAHLRVLSQMDGNGQSMPFRFLSTDTLQINLHGRLQYLMDGPELAGGSK